MKTDNQRRNFFRKAGVAAVGAGLLGAIPATLAAKSAQPTKTEPTVAIKINPMAVKREKRK